MKHCDECGWDEGYGEHEEAHDWWEMTRDWTREDWDDHYESVALYIDTHGGEA